MALTILEQLRQDIIDTLKGIQTVAGYSDDVTVEAVDAEENAYTRWRDGLIVVYEDDAEQDESPLGAEAWFQTFCVTCFVIERGDAGATPLERRLNLIAADVVKALSIDRQRGGLAIWTEFPPPAMSNERGQRGFVRIFARIRYRTLLGDPYRQF